LYVDAIFEQRNKKREEEQINNDFSNRNPSRKKLTDNNHNNGSLRTIGVWIDDHPLLYNNDEHW